MPSNALGLNPTYTPSPRALPPNSGTPHSRSPPWEVLPLCFRAGPKQRPRPIHAPPFLLAPPLPEPSQPRQSLIPPASRCSEQNPEGALRLQKGSVPLPAHRKEEVESSPLNPSPLLRPPPLFQILGIYKQGLKCRGEMELQGCWAEFFGKSCYLGEDSYFGGVIAKE